MTRGYVTRVYINTDPPADVLAAQARGECAVVRIVGTLDRERVNRALVAYADAVIAREDAPKVPA